jgi:polysaccharide export outer membrane protein
MRYFLGLLLVVILLGCSASTPKNVNVVTVTPDVIFQYKKVDPPTAIPVIEAPTHRLKSHDKLVVTIYSTLPDGTIRRLYPPLTAENDNFETQVLPDGTVNMPMIGLVPVQGLTLAEAQEKIVGEYRTQKVFNKPSVLMGVIERSGHKVTVLGAVHEAGEHIISDDSVSVLTAIGRAKGATQSADLTSVVIRHADGGQTPVNVRELLANATPPPMLFAGDVVFVPEEKEKQAFVLGEVPRPQAVSFQQGRLSPLQAVAMAGGLDARFARASNVYVVRGFEDTPHDVTIFNFNMVEPTKLALAEQFALQPRDIVYVSTTALADWNRFISLLIPSNLTALRARDAFE